MSAFLAFNNFTMFLLSSTDFSACFTCFMQTTLIQMHRCCSGSAQIISSNSRHIRYYILILFYFPQVAKNI